LTDSQKGGIVPIDPKNGVENRDSGGRRVATSQTFDIAQWDHINAKWQVNEMDKGIKGTGDSIRRRAHHKYQRSGCDTPIQIRLLCKDGSETVVETLGQHKLPDTENYSPEELAFRDALNDLRRFSEDIMREGGHDWAVVLAKSALCEAAAERMVDAATNIIINER
jgi:hypothetical protein